ncbi:type II secretion system protein GspM [Ramlibacter sp. H39-3-26]|uniref:type II secretion system protein GspM n=1 Tax=Curvibacter soli TaxID=3031331 RepID=UPI0023DBF18A|nr:type II secretion system protein GspM [Ramlibacter sp. H39-3-26]MDF1486404.1 type II secretion system protein GspM [Ramlibacter sp. H39-3-26]
MRTLLNRDNLLVAASLALLLVPLALCAGYVAQKYTWAQSRLDELEPRYARLQGLSESRDAITQANIQTHAVLARYVYPASQDPTQAGNDAQQRIRNVFSAAGLQIVSSQVLASTNEKNFDRIPLSVRTEGDLLALQSALAVLSSQSPAIIVNGLNIQAIGAVKADVPQKLAGQFDLFVLRAKS